MRARSYDRIRDVPQDTWDSVAPPDFFFSRAFLRVMEDSAVEDARYRYLVLFQDEAAVGLAVTACFTLKLDLLAGNLWIKRMRTAFPMLLDVPIVCCGIPASFGQHHLHVVQPVLLRQAVDCVHAAMEQWAAETRSGMLVWKEWHPPQGARPFALSAGYHALPTLPDHVLAALPATMEEFVGSLRASYRRKYRSAAALLSAAGPVWTRGSLQLTAAPFTESDAAPFHQAYLRVMARTRVRLETYPASFFATLASSGVGARRLHLANTATGQSITALLIPSGRTMHFALIAKADDRHTDALYTTLLQCIVLYAIREECSEVRLGQTSSYAKCSIGAEPRRLETFIKLRSPFKQTLLQRFGSLLFPEVTVPDLHVFRRRDECIG